MERVWSALVVLIVLVLIVSVRPSSNTYFNNYPLAPDPPSFSFSQTVQYLYRSDDEG